MHTIEQLVDSIKSGNEIAFYKSMVWLRKRKQILKRDNYECQHCKLKGMYSKAETVHHIKHLKDYPELAIEDNNLISLCNVCHNIVHPEKLKIIKKEIVSEERWE
ncbi:HNH endonuclease [Acetoanaerobium noterae]|uniref:Putative HNH nuclease YajD n=1 Tax=Acetoanaerobium noterae TaxID=745369 RepID=A0A1T5A0X3_9FIRM|nr:HNH endonuclease [Acetoanaerobium noterae]SKB28419.1 HNH endonuclease [Acetoanaerobium noterae]